MAEISSQTLYHRSAYCFVLIAVVIISVICVVISLLILHPPKEIEEGYTGKTNVLFIIIDDLRPALRCYGDVVAITPNIDALASRSIIFKNAYAQQALDGPSRISFLTSRRPDHLHLYDEGTYWRDVVGNFVTLPEHFKNHGYETISIGKVFQHGNVSNGTDDYPYSWTNDLFKPLSQEYETKPVCHQSQRNLICPVDVENQPEKTLPDIESTEYAIEFLRNKSKSPNKHVKFFLGVGFYKPHIPYRIPRSYFDLYPEMDLAPNPKIQQKFPTVSWNPWYDIREMDDVKSLNVSSIYGPLPEDFQKLARQGYYASVSYIDDQLGKLLEVLEETGYAEHTTIVLLGDNGFSLGEHQEWSKYSNFEVSLQVPLIVHIPEFTDGPERKPFKRTSVLDLVSVNNISTRYFSTIIPPAYVSTELVELVDVFPTLAEISNIAVPPLCNPVNMSEFCSEGISFFPVIEHLVLDRSTPFSWKTAAFSQYPRPSLFPIINSDQPELKDIEIMGYSIRTNIFRYTEWVAFDNENFKPDWPLIISRELYNHVDDPLETENLCDEDIYSNTVISLSRRIKRNWRQELPPGLFDSL